MKKIPGVLLLLVLTGLTGSLGAQPAAADAIENAHHALWSKFIDEHGLILDYEGEIPTPEECALGKPNALGWWTPIENGPMFTGLYLPALCERARRSVSSEDQSRARRLAQGLIKSASVSDVPGMIVRGMATDGQSHYPLGSDDQTHPWFLGLYAYLTSGIPDEEEKKQITDKMIEVAEALEANDWKCPADGTFKGQSRGAFTYGNFRSAARYLFMLKVMHEVSGDPVWAKRYEKALYEVPRKSDKTRLELCTTGYSADLKKLGDRSFSFWTNFGAQSSLAWLIRMEKDEVLREKYREGLAANAAYALEHVSLYKEFDNQDTSKFGFADWREVNINWFEQKTPADAEKASKQYDAKKRGTRKQYEAKYMDAPLAAAAVAAFAENGQGRDIIESAIAHYDYSKLYISRFFFAECAYYTLPPQ
jgi:hypothetical protein